jgi:hypothetical protein
VLVRIYEFVNINGMKYRTDIPPSDVSQVIILPPSSVSANTCEPKTMKEESDVRNGFETRPTCKEIYY